jgi:hypothetical protein
MEWHHVGKKISLAALARYFANGGEHDELAATISVIPKKFADEYCPFCLGTVGRILLMVAVSSPPVEHDANEDFYKCSICKTIFGKNISDLWSTADD